MRGTVSDVVVKQGQTHHCLRTLTVSKNVPLIIAFLTQGMPLDRSEQVRLGNVIV